MTRVLDGASEGKGDVPIVESRAPATGEVLGRAPASDRAAVRAAIERARAAQAAWAALAVEQRCAQLLKFRDALIDGAEELIELAAAECGKPRQDVLVHEVMVIADLIGFYARRAGKILAPREISLHLFKHRKVYVHYVPRGVVGVIAPANYPIATALSDAVAAWLTGNAVVLKPSEHTPLVALKLREIFVRAGLRAELFEVVMGAGAAGEWLIEGAPDHLAFTGTTEVGRKVAAKCGERLITCRLGLSGHAPAIVCEDADLERAARAVVYAGFANSGQLCLRVARVYAHAGIYDALVKRVHELTRELKQGNPLVEEVDVGALTTSEAVARSKAAVADAVDRGARLVCGGAERPGPGNFFQPTVLAECDHSMQVMREEVFGPVLPIVRVADDEEALELANATPFGLVASVFTRDKQRGGRLAERIRASTVMLNDVLIAYACPEAPMGGAGDSGYGRVHGDQGLRDMCLLRHVNMDRVRPLSREPVWFPYSAGAYRAMLSIMRALMRGGSPVKKVIDLL